MTYETTRRVCPMPQKGPECVSGVKSRFQPSFLLLLHLRSKFGERLTRDAVPSRCSTSQRFVHEGSQEFRNTCRRPVPVLIEVGPRAPFLRVRVTTVPTNGHDPTRLDLGLALLQYSCVGVSLSAGPSPPPPAPHPPPLKAWTLKACWDRPPRRKSAPSGLLCEAPGHRDGDEDGLGRRRECLGRRPIHSTAGGRRVTEASDTHQPTNPRRPRRCTTGVLEPVPEGTGRSARGSPGGPTSPQPVPVTPAAIWSGEGPEYGPRRDTGKRNRAGRP